MRNFGRFISEDPARANNNWYIYASNNPLIRIDPTGLADYIFGTSPLKDVPSSIPSETATTPGKVIPFPQQRIQSNDAIGLAGFGVGLLQGFLLHTRDFWNEKGALKDLRPDGSFDDVTPLQIKTWQLMNERGAHYETSLPPGFVERNGHAWNPDAGYVTFGEAWDVYNQVISGLKYGDEVSNLGKRISYAKHFENELLNFNEGYEIKQVLEKDLLLVQYHSNAEIGKGRTLKLWTTTSEANRFSTIDEVMDNLALLSMWGDRSMVSVAKVPAGTRVKHAIGTARKQINLETNEIREGGGLQILFEEFNPELDYTN